MIEDNYKNANITVKDSGQEFLTACLGARKAWHKTNLLSMSKSIAIDQVSNSLLNDDAQKITDLLLEIMGPVAPVNLKDAMGESSLAHRKLAGLICLLAMRIAVNDRSTYVTPSVDLERVKKMLVHWIDFKSLGIFTDEFSQKISDQSLKMSQLFDNEKHSDRIRLAIIAPLAAPLESMIVVSIFNKSVVSTLVKKSVDLAKSIVDEDNQSNSPFTNMASVFDKSLSEHQTT